MTRTTSSTHRGATSFLVALLLCGCTTHDGSGRTGLDPETPSRPGRQASALATATDPAACTGTDAHAKHEGARIGCSVCHACAGALAFGTMTFPRGAGTGGGTITPNGSATTCLVTCHAPLGADLRPVAWNAGPLSCTSCHDNVGGSTAVPVRSTHLVGSTASSCASCHDSSRHTSGTVWLLGGDGTSTEATCIGCHSGLGQTLAGDTGPLLVGWTDAARGDFHGARPGTCRFDALDASGRITRLAGGLTCPADQPQMPSALRITSRWWYQSGTTGPWAWTCDIETIDASGNRVGPVRTRQACPDGTVLNSSCNNPATSSGCYPTTLVTRGFGGTLLPPHVRGEPALTCDACHDFHSSTNSFLLASRVNGVAITPGVIDRAGVGAQALCNACHSGDRHEVCKNCHKEIWTTDGEYSWFEGNPVDPAPDGSACFYCHGHEGLLRMQVATPEYPGGGHPFGISGQSKDQPACSHCHSAWAPPATEYAPPTFPSWNAGAPVVTGVTATTATLSWRTSEPATSYVEYGIGTAGWVAGNDALTWDHAVTLTGLTPSATYLWRVRTSDAFRNVTRTALQTFSTPGAMDVPRVDLAPVSVGATVGTYTTVATLLWYPVTAPSGTAVEYEVQLASDPAFTHLVNGSLAGPGVPGTSVGDSGWVSGTVTTAEGKPARSFPATITNIPQDSCGDINPNYYFWRVRARDAQGHVSEWSTPASFGVFAGDPWC